MAEMNPVPVTPVPVEEALEEEAPSVGVLEQLGVVEDLPVVCSMVWNVEAEAMLPGLGVRTRSAPCENIASVPVLIHGVPDLICLPCSEWLEDNPQSWAELVE